MVIETQYGFLVLKLLNNSQLQRRVRTHDEPLRTSTWESESTTTTTPKALFA